MLMVKADWSICTSSVWAIIIFLSHTHAGNFDYTQCDISNNFRSDYVSASFKSLEAGRGCETNATSSSGQEVHIIAVVPLESDDDDERWITVRLGIHSRRKANLDDPEGVSFQEEARPAIFILHSVEPVRWKVEMHGISSQEKHLFMLSTESSIRFLGKRTRILAKSRKRMLPFSANSSAIYTWAQRRFGAVTSFSEIPDLTVKFYIGRDTSAGLHCDLNDLIVSRRLFTYRDLIKPLTGCVSKRRKHHVRVKPVYIIELLEAPSPSPGIMGIDLEIMPIYSGDNVRSKGQNSDSDPGWDFSLVIRSPPNLQWNLHSRHIPGSIDIVADAGAEVRVTGVKMSTVSLRADDIKASGRQLVEWSQDYIAPVQMYAGIYAANTIKLRVPPQEINLASTRDHADHDGHYPKVQREGGVSGSQDYEDVIRQEKLSKLMQITCTHQILQVAISKKFFQISGLDKSKISLKDPTCKPTAETNENIILCTGLLNCGTQSQDMDSVTSFSNAVVIHTPPSVTNNFVQDDQGSGFFDEDINSWSRDLSLVMDDEDMNSHAVVIPVECKLPVTVQSLMGTLDLGNQLCGHGQPQPGSLCSINLYATASFSQPRLEFPAAVSKNSSLFVMAAVIDQDITLLVDSCWFSVSSQPYDKNAETKRIVTQGCSQNDSVNWLDDLANTPLGANLRYTKFRVKVTDVFASHSQLYLHCQFRTCQRGESTPEHPCSIDASDRCRQITAPVDHNLPTELPIPDCGPLTIGPLELTDKDISVKFFSGNSKLMGGSGRENGQKQRVIIEGLDSATVVGIAFAAFVIGILLMAALWFIHSHTGPIKHGMSNPGELTANGDLITNAPPPVTA